MTQGCPTCNNIMAGNGNGFAPAPTSKKDLSRLLSDLAEDADGGSKDSEEVCLEKRVYYRLISGRFFFFFFNFAFLVFRSSKNDAL